MQKYEIKEGDNPVGYWAILVVSGTQVATIYDPHLAQRIATLLNEDEQTKPP
jgi:hypothetical protein